MLNGVDIKEDCFLKNKNGACPAVITGREQLEKRCLS